MNGLTSLNETYMEYSLAHTDDLIGFWTSSSWSQQAVAKAPTSVRLLVLFTKNSNCYTQLTEMR